MSDANRDHPDTVHAADHAYRLIREEILSGRRAAGEWLRESEMAESTRVSRTPVREAFRRLTAEGLVRYERHRGVQVQSWSERDLDEIFSLRSVLEPWGCRLAAIAGTADVTKLNEMACRMDELAPGGHPSDVDKLTELNNQFHQMILKSADNERLNNVTASVIQVPLVWRTFARYTPEALLRSLAHHHELVTALAAGDENWAESVMRSHIRAAWHSIRSTEKTTPPTESAS
ncbi:GntR family transcriptional regulator [Amycolatopsis orientalis]|uniref:GntR family transcriptional regulator n=1 Tax=Amycolatopsis orientalis TaxID=31958 RepID=UPI00039F65E5|nr:GntR family transcriptional regulator [Amycolatopsis orientalis]